LVSLWPPVLSQFRRQWPVWRTICRLEAACRDGFVLPVDEQHRNLDAMLHEGEERLADLIGQQQFAPAPSGVA